MVAVAAAAAAVLLVHRSSGGHHDSSAGRNGCRIGLPLQVIVDPTIAPAVHTIVHAWARGRPAVDGLCINVSMAIQDSSAAEQALITSTDTTLWIPNSSVWPARLLSDAPRLAKQVSTVRPVASSPLVLATTPGHARALATAAASGWTAGLGGNSAVDLPDPTSTAEGSLALLALQGGAGGQTASADTLASAYVRLGMHTLSGVAEGLQAWSAGLWSFSRQASPADNWTEQVPVGPVSSDRADLLDAARSLPTRVGGDTGLYDTALAAFESARDNYRSGRVNSVVLLTDGANLDPGGISLPACSAP